MANGQRDVGINSPASAALAGYEYQIDVSVWLALDVMLASKMCHEIELEPASQEDLEATLPDTEPGRVTSTLTIEKYMLVVQAKLRTGDAWTVADFNRLLHHGGAKRRSAADRLLNFNLRYLLMTNAGVNGVARELQVGRIGAWPSPTTMPNSILRHLPADSAGRVAIVANLDEEKLETRIKFMLTDRFRVPNANWDSCLKAFRDEARIRILGGGGGRWRRSELEGIIRAHNGSIASSPELARYVYPTNWKLLRRVLGDHNAALIVGQSGTGKTMATRKLYEDLQQEIPGLSRVHVTNGPKQLMSDQTEPPVLYDIEDPWGRFSFDPENRPWNDQLAQCCARANHDRLMIATTRLDVGQAAGSLEDVRQWIVPLEAEHYGNTERRRLYLSRIDELPRDLHEIARMGIGTVLKSLHSPLEIQKFFDALPFIDRVRLNNPPGFLFEAIHRAHQESIERTVIEQIEERKEERPAAILWALLKTTDRLSLSTLRIIEEEISYHDSMISEGLTPFLNFFVSARNLRQEENIVSYYHPRVEAGIERTLDRHQLVVRRTLSLLISQLALSKKLVQEWGVATASRILLAMEKMPHLSPQPSPDAQDRIDDWLAIAVMHDSEQFEEHLRIARVAGSANSNVSEVARYLLNRPDESFGGLDMWGPLERDEPWYARLRADPATRAVIKRFLQDALPFRSDYFPSSFADETARLLPNSTEVFIGAATRFADLGVHFAADAIAEGALNDLDGFEIVVNRAVQVLSPTEERQKRMEDTWLAIVNREYSDEYTEYLSENDDGYTAQNFLRAYVEKMLATRGWQSIADHRHAADLLPYWLADLAKRAARSSVGEDEVAGAHRLGSGTPHEEECWDVLRHAWNPSFTEALRRRVRRGHEDRSVRRATLRCLLTHLPEDFTDIGRGLLQDRQFSPLLEIAIDFAHLRANGGSGDENLSGVTSAATSALPGTVRELSDAEWSVAKEERPELSPDAVFIASNAQNGSIDVRRFRVQLDAFVHIPVEDDVRFLLTQAQEEEIALHAVRAAVRRNLDKELWASLNHRFARVGALALKAIADAISPPLPECILKMSASASSLIRQALVEVLGEKANEAHIPTLLLLAQDTWTSSYQYHGEDDVFPIARAAVEAFGTIRSLDVGLAETLYGIAIETTDNELRHNIFVLLVRAAGSIFQKQLLDLATKPGPRRLARGAANSLLCAGEDVKPEVASQITPDYLAKRPATIAARLTVLFAARARIQEIRAAAESLSVYLERRVLLLLIIRLLADRDLDAARDIAKMLPNNHPGVAFALDPVDRTLSNDILDDLGEPTICAQVLSYLQRRQVQGGV